MTRLAHCIVNTDNLWLLKNDQNIIISLDMEQVLKVQDQ